MIPLLLGGLAAISGLAGLIKGSEAKNKLKMAQSIIDRAKKEHEEKLDELENKKEEVKINAENLGQYKMRIYKKTISQYINAIKPIKSNIKVKDRRIYEKLDISVSDDTLSQMVLYSDVDMEDAVIESSAEGALTGAMAGIGLYGLGSFVGTASTGIAIGELTGVAATNATLAWLGGGSLAAGGLGMTGGMAVIGGMVLGPAILVGSFALDAKAEKAITQALDYQSKIEQANEKIDQFISALEAINIRIREIHYVIEKLEKRASKQINKVSQIRLHKPTFFQKLSYWIRFQKPPEQTLTRKETKQIQKASILVRKLGDILETPIIDEEWKITEENTQLLIKLKKEFDNE